MARYYVYAIHLDETDNRLYGEPFEEIGAALIFEKEMERGCYLGDNYMVRMITADSDEEAARKADKLRPRPKLPENQKKAEVT